MIFTKPKLLVVSFLTLSIFFQSCSNENKKGTENTPEDIAATTVKIPVDTNTNHEFQKGELATTDTSFISNSSPEILLKSNIMGLKQRIYLLKAKDDMDVSISILEEDTTLYFSFFQDDHIVAGPELQTFDGKMKKEGYYAVQVGFGKGFQDTHAMANFTLAIRKKIKKINS